MKHVIVFVSFLHIYFVLYLGQLIKENHEF